MEQEDWDSRYASDELVWKAEPNRFLVTEATGLPFLFGAHDMVITWDRLEELQRRSEEITRAVQGLGVYLRFQTVEEDPAGSALTWPPVLHQRNADHHV